MKDAPMPNQVWDDLMAKLEEATRKLDSAKRYAGMPVSQYCRETRCQCCHICDDLDCGDNFSEYAKKYKSLRRVSTVRKGKDCG